MTSGFSCPNRDGTKAAGGCTFCFEPRENAAQPPLSVQFEAGRRALDAKWPGALPVAYFQSFSNTHASVESVRSMLEQTVLLPGVGGIRLATRADCVGEEMAELLAEYARKIPLEVELGLQTVHDDTAERINRRHTFGEFCAGFARLRERGIYLCVHLLNGLPGETPDRMRYSAEALALLKPDGVKLHMLYIAEGTALASQYLKQPFALLSRDEYVGIICDQLERLPPETVIERLTGDAPRDRLIAPLWTLEKRAVLNAIDKELSRRNSRQGKRWEESK